MSSVLSAGDGYGSISRGRVPKCKIRGQKTQCSVGKPWRRRYATDEKSLFVLIALVKQGAAGKEMVKVEQEKRVFEG